MLASASSDWLGVAAPLVAAVVAWLANEWRKRASEERLRREERHRLLIQHSRGFYVATQNEAEKARFLEEVNLCWLYCPDAVIHAIYGFLDTVKTGAAAPSGDAEKAFGRLVLAMRRDLWSLALLRRSSLKADDFRHFAPTETVRAALMREHSVRVPIGSSVADRDEGRSAT
jgi:hypothetical protein